MKIRPISFSALKQYQHPSARLFRSLELKATYELVKDINFKQPSLDLGCGDGYISSLLFNDQFSYGLDNNEAGDVQVAQEKKRYGKFLLEWAENMSLKSNSLNFVFSNSVIEHIPPQEAVLKEVARVLKPKGRFLFTTPSNNFRNFLYVSNILDNIGLHPIAQMYSNERNKRLNHYHLYSADEWKKRLAKYGFEIERISYCIPKQTLQLWDKMALEVLARKIFDPQAEEHVYAKYEAELKRHLKMKLVDDEGADLVICAVKK